MSSNYFGLAGIGEIIWYFKDNLELKYKIIDGSINRIQFGYRPLLVLPTWLTIFYSTYLKTKHDYAPTHAFVILEVETSDQLVQVFMDFDGSVNIREDLVENDGREYYLDRWVNSLPFTTLLEEIYKGLPPYHHRFNNCKHFTERLASIFFDDNSYTKEYINYFQKKK
jgi:hypothetical protein